MTIETEDGKRKEHAVSGELFGQLPKKDVGVAYIKGGHLLLISSGCRF